MYYSSELWDQIYVKDYGFLSFTKILSGKKREKFHDGAKRSAKDVLKNTSKGVIKLQIKLAKSHHRVVKYNY